MMRKLTKNEKGFTLIELVVVVAILGVISAIVVPNFNSLAGKGQTEACQMEERMVTTVTMAYASDTGECPTEIEELADYFEAPTAIQGSYDFSGIFPNCVVEQTACPASEEPEPEPEPGPKPKPGPKPGQGPINPRGPWSY